MVITATQQVLNGTKWDKMFPKINLFSAFSVIQHNNTHIRQKSLKEKKNLLYSTLRKGR
jgi:hypothetical protein